MIKNILNPTIDESLSFIDKYHKSKPDKTMLLVIGLFAMGVGTVAASDTTVSIEPELIEGLSSGDPFTIMVNVSCLDHDLRGIRLDLTYDPTVFEVDTITVGDIFGTTPYVDYFPEPGSGDDGNGTVHYGIGRKSDNAKPEEATFLIVVFNVTSGASDGTYPLTLGNVELNDKTAANISIDAITNGAVTIGISVPDVVLTIQNNTFGNLRRGANLSLDPSFTLENQGTGDAKVQAYFTSNYNGLHGMVNDTYVIGGSNFTISGFPLTDDGTAVEFESLLLAGEKTAYNTNLKVPENQVSGGYLGVVELIYEGV